LTGPAIVAGHTVTGLARSDAAANRLRQLGDYFPAQAA
jgi:hypothetical protein